MLKEILLLRHLFYNLQHLQNIQERKTVEYKILNKIS